MHNIWYGGFRSPHGNLVAEHASGADGVLEKHLR
jgi:hypothetical protein